MQNREEHGADYAEVKQVSILENVAMRYIINVLSYFPATDA